MNGSPGGLTAHVVIRYPSLTVDVRLEVAPGEVVGVTGPNGAGKTTLLRAIAGLEAIDGGRIEIAGRVVDDPAASLHVPPARRRVGVLFQDHRLFPHLSAVDNVAFPLRAQGVERREARRRAAEWLGRVGLDGHDGHRPHQLSGGQSQRVALARVLAQGPDVLLLDEPLAAIDAASRAPLRAELARQLGAFAGPTVLVSHHDADLDALARRTLHMSAGQFTS